MPSWRRAWAATSSPRSMRPPPAPRPSCGCPASTATPRWTCATRSKADSASRGCSAFPAGMASPPASCSRKRCTPPTSASTSSARSRRSALREAERGGGRRARLRGERTAATRGHRPRRPPLPLPHPARAQRRRDVRGPRARSLHVTSATAKAAPVEVPPDAPAFDRALGLAGRDLPGLPVVSGPGLAHDRGAEIEVATRPEAKNHQAVVLFRGAGQLAPAAGEGWTPPALPAEALIEVVTAGRQCAHVEVAAQNRSELRHRQRAEALSLPARGRCDTLHVSAVPRPTGDLQ